MGGYEVILRFGSALQVNVFAHKSYMYHQMTFFTSLRHSLAIIIKTQFSLKVTLARHKGMILNDRYMSILFYF